MNVKEFEATHELQEQLAEIWQKEGCWTFINLVAENDCELIFEAEKHSTQELYLIRTRMDGTIKELFKEARN